MHSVNNVHGLEITGFLLVNMEDLSSVLDDTLEIDGKVMWRENVRVGEYELPQDTTIFYEAGVFFVQFGLQLKWAIINADLQNKWQKPSFFIHHVHPVIVLELLVRHPKCINLLPLNECAIHPVFTIDELHEISERVPYSSIVANHDILQHLNKTLLDIPSLCHLDGHINQSLSTHHGVEEVLLRHQPSQIGVLYEPSCFGAEVILSEVQQCPMTESKQ